MDSDAARGHTSRFPAHLNRVDEGRAVTDSRDAYVHVDCGLLISVTLDLDTVLAE